MKNFKRSFSHPWQTKLNWRILAVFGLSCIMLLMLLLPVVKFFSFTLADGLKGYNDKLYQAIKETFVISICVIGIVMPFSAICAFAVTYTNMKCREVFSALCTLPLFLPPISLAFSLLFLWGKNGLIYTLLRIRIPFMGRTGIIMGLTIYTFPPAFLMFRNAMRGADVVLYENAALLGIPLRKYIFGILIPQIKKSVITVFFSLMMLSMTEYGICLVVGGKIKTLALLTYRQVLGSMDFSAASAMATLLVVPFLLLLISDIFTPHMRKGIQYRNQHVPPDKIRDCICCFFLCIVSFFFFCSILPFLLLSFIDRWPLGPSVSLKHIIGSLKSPCLKYYFNSIVIAIMSSILGTFLAFWAAYCAHKGKHRLKKRFFYTVATIPQMLPGLIYGISYMLFFKRTAVYNTLVILVMVNIAHFFATPFLYSYHSFCSLGKELDDLIELYGVPLKYAIRDIYVPCMRKTLLDMSFFLFSNAMITISAVVFLYTVQTMPYAVILNNYEGSTEYLNRTAATSLILLVTNCMAFIVIFFLKRFRNTQD